MHSATLLPQVWPTLELRSSELDGSLPPAKHITDGLC
jgi:hypothetical protein